MKAVRIHSYGGRDVLNYEDAPRPEPGAGEVLLRVHATSLNPLDAAIRSGYMTSYFNHTLPLILGTDIAGLVEQVSPGVETFKPGDHVFGRGGLSAMALMPNISWCRRLMWPISPTPWMTRRPRPCPMFS